MDELKLGLCNPPEPIYLYVKSGELNGESYLWYQYDINNDITTPVQQRGLTGYISELRLTTKEFKGKDEIKLNIVVNAGEVYIIRTGVETNFAKAFLLAASLVQDFSKPLIIAAIAGKENVVFCNLYDATTRVRIHKEWNAIADWGEIIKNIQLRLGNEPSPISKPESCPEHARRVMAVRTALGLDQQVVVELLKPLNINHPQYLTKPQCDAFIMSLAIYCVKGVLDQEIAIANYGHNVLSAIAKGMNETDAVYRWVNRCLDAEDQETVAHAR